MHACVHRTLARAVMGEIGKVPWPIGGCRHFSDKPLICPILANPSAKRAILALIMPSAGPSVAIKDALRGFAAAALVCSGISLVRSPFDAYFSGLGLIRLFSSGVLAVAITTAVTFIVMMVVGLPIWIVLRRLGLSKLWHFALLGIVAGSLLASRVNPNAYRSAEHNRWARGQETIRPALDATMFFLWGIGSFTAFWIVTYRHRERSL
jgi:hypothetical protein